MIFASETDGVGMTVHEASQILLGASAGVAVVFAALLASSASIRAGEMWAAQHRFRATALASFAGISGISAAAGLVLGAIWVIVSSPVGS